VAIVARDGGVDIELKEEEMSDNKYGLSEHEHATARGEKLHGPGIPLEQLLAQVTPETAVIFAVCTAEKMCDPDERQGVESSTTGLHWNIPKGWAPDDIASIFAQAITDVAMSQDVNPWWFIEQIKEELEIIEDCAPAPFVDYLPR
jgi:hypothetical protein